MNTDESPRKSTKSHENFCASSSRLPSKSFFPPREPGRGIRTLSPREERVGREPERGALQRTELLLSPALSSLLRPEERESRAGALPVQGLSARGGVSGDSFPEPRSSRRKEVHTISGEPIQSLLTSAATGVSYLRRSPRLETMNGSKSSMARQTSVGMMPREGSTRRFPSPRLRGRSPLRRAKARPSPAGRGGASSRAGTIPDASDLRAAGSRFSLSPSGNDSVGVMDRPHPPSLRFGATGPVLLPRGEGTRFRPRWEFAKRCAFSNAGKSSPSPWGEGRGEGERSFSTESFRPRERAVRGNRAQSRLPFSTAPGTIERCESSGRAGRFPG